MDVRAKFVGDSKLNSGRIMRLFGRPDLFYALLCSILHFAADRKQLVMSSSRFVGPIVRDKRVKFRDLRLNCSRDIPQEVV